MANRQTVNFLLKSFELNLGIIPNFASLKKATRDMVAGLPKAVAEKISAKELNDRVAEFAKTGNFENARHAFTVWVTEAISRVEKMADNELESHRGRDTTNLVVELFGKRDSVPVHAANLIRGSKLAELMAKGPGDGFTQWKDLATVLNMVSATVRKIVPESERPKRGRKPKSDN